MRAQRDGAITAALLALGLGVAFVSGPEPRPAFNLRDYENSVYSQAGEDGILEKLFSVIEPTHKYAIEFGAGDGVTLSNVRNLMAHHGWGGLLIEGDPARAEMLRKNYEGLPRVRTAQAWVFPGNVELLFEEHDVPKDLDLLVIDIDSNDYYVWRAIREYRPKVVVIEFNGRFPPPYRMVVEFHPMLYWSERDIHHGASIQSLYELGREKGYELIGPNYRGINLFFVDAQYFPRFGIADNSPAAVYRPFNFNVQVDPEALRMGSLARPEDLVIEPGTIEKKFHLDR